VSQLSSMVNIDEVNIDSSFTGKFGHISPNFQNGTLRALDEIRRTY
jgi:hypothetical protein